MYIADARTVDGEPATVPKTRLGLLGGNVVALGTVSLVTDVSSEMVAAVLPLYLVVGLGLSPVVFGLLDGLYIGATALARIAGGHVADRFQRRKLVAGIGYGMSAAAKPALLAVGGSVPLLAGVLTFDRAGKGLRTAPRDALISLSVPAELHGRAFGLHRTMDTIGAFLGPIAAFGLLWGTAGAYDAVFVVSACVAVFAVVLLALSVRDRREPVAKPAAVSVRAGLRLLRGKAFRRICLTAAVLGLVTISDGFLYLLLSDRVALESSFFPLLPLGTAAFFLLLALPFGALADRVDRRWVFLGGHVLLLAGYGVVQATAGGRDQLVPVLVVLALHGGFYAATDGVLMALAAPLLPQSLRASGLAIVQTGQALTRLLASVAFGLGWTLLGPEVAVWIGLATLPIGTVVALWLLRPTEGNPSEQTS